MKLTINKSNYYETEMTAKIYSDRLGGGVQILDLCTTGTRNFIFC